MQHVPENIILTAVSVRSLASGFIVSGKLRLGFQRYNHLETIGYWILTAFLILLGSAYFDYLWTNLIGVLIGGFLIGVLPYCLFFLIMFSPKALSDFETPREVWRLWGVRGSRILA